jgi:hypothetical protein
MTYLSASVGRYLAEAGSICLSCGKERRGSQLVGCHGLGDSCYEDEDEDADASIT